MNARFSSLLVGGLLLVTQNVSAQDVMPVDNGLATYHTAPRYRESESHPLRIAAYVLHPIGWLAREVIFRPVDYLISSTAATRSIFGYREPFDYRHADCFTAGDDVPDCRTLSPYANITPGTADIAEPKAADDLTKAVPEQQIVFPTVAFDFDKSSLNPLGKERVAQAAKVLESAPTIKVVIEGHADARGADDYNLKLGTRRAETVKNELVTLGIQADRMSTVSYGETHPAVTGSSPEAYAANRRVEFTVKSAEPVASAPITAPTAQAETTTVIKGS